ncbi:ABC-2 type transport system permease protein [Microbacterium sp. AK009]|uniref:ABC transporter permease n=1 Tax=Microbacterium sp. AK009 TaxID=2723068 RepID=UPI0015C75952|nr:polyketide antibiotic transporter [Microbacterium sp. AK009]NYF16772.1 ABC-2 type transport system permease protein [Microbacterium sp. AK009]
MILLTQRLRRDGVQLLVWILATAALCFSATAGVNEAFAAESERRTLLAVALANPTILLFRGLPFGTSEGAFLVFTILPFLVLLGALMASFLAVRHVRAEEESGRADAVSATPAGRRAPFVATVVHGILACVLLGTATAVAFIAAGLEAGGSIALGGALAASAAVFLGVGLVAAQLFRSSRAANSFSVGVILSAFLVAGIGNALGTPSDDLTRMESSGLAWVSPFAWAENVRAFADDAPGPILLAVGVSAALLTVAAALQATRDLGAGVIAPRPGRAAASALLSRPFGLAVRVSAGSLVAWVVGSAVVGALSTSLGDVIDEIATQNPAVTEMLDRLAAQGSMDQGLVVTFFVMVGTLAACFGVQTVQRARQEETHGTAEQTLATPVARVGWLGAFLTTALGGIVVIVAAAMAAASLAVFARGGDPAILGDVVVAGAGQILGAAVFPVLTALVFTLLPRATSTLGWVLVIAAASLALFGTLLGLDEDVVSLSPFAATPVPDADGIAWNGSAWLIVLTVAGVASSLMLMRRREVATGG